MRAAPRVAHAPRVHRAVPAIAAVLAMTGVFAAAGPAAADDPLAPGQTRAVVVPVPETWAADAVEVTVTAGDLVQVENGCLEPEAEAGDDCSSTVGELAGKLTTAVAWGRTDDDDCVPGGEPAVLDLFGRTTARLTEVSGVDCLLLEMTFADGDTDDVAQSDGLTFDLDLVAQGLPDPVVPGRGDEDTGGRAADGQADGAAGPADQNGGAAIGQGADAQSAGGQVQGTGPGAGAVAPPVGGVPVAPQVARTPAGPVLDRVDAQIAVGNDGVAVETQAAEAFFGDSVLAWGGLLLGAVALGWVGFWMVLRRRRRAEART
jgi:hypothetical protein